MVTKSYINELSFKLIHAAIEVHKELGPGLLESVYQKCYNHEIKSMGLSFQTQVWVPVKYKTIELECDLRLDVIVEDLIIIELKAVELLHPVYDAQVLSYMKLLQKPKGLLFNFHSDNITKNMRTFVNDYYGTLPE